MLLTPMRLIGERPVSGRTPDSLIALHDAGYREVLARLGPGRFLDVGCGLGDGTARFLAPDRDVVGVDYDPATARAAAAGYRDVTTACMDGAHLGLRAGAFDWVCSSHLIEHFVAPEEHAREVARVLRPGGTAFFITPNAPADFENPYHVSLFEPAGLRDLLGRWFEEVEVVGLDGSPAVKEDFERRRRAARRLLALDVFDLRHRLPRRWFVALHGVARRLAYAVMGARWSGGATGIDAGQFFITDRLDETTLVLFAIARRSTSGG